MLNVPEQAGDYFVTYRLSAPVTGKFGKPLRTTFTVEEEQQEFVESPPESAHASVVKDQDADQDVDDFVEQVCEPPRSRMMQSPVQNPDRMIQRQGLFKQEPQKAQRMIESPAQQGMMSRSDIEFKPEFKFPEQLKALKEFGFPEEACKKVLVATSGNVEEAVNILLN